MVASRLFPQRLSVCVILVLAGTAAADPTWWGGDYLHRIQATVSNGAAQPLPTGYTVDLTFDHAALVSAGKAMASGDDLRVVYWDGASNTELNRVLKPGSAWNSATTTISFATQAAIPASGDSGEAYWLYYRNPAAAAPPANPSNVYLFFDDFEDGSIDWSGRWQSVNQGKYSEGGGRVTLDPLTNSSQPLQTQQSFNGMFVWEFDWSASPSATDTAYSVMGTSGSHGDAKFILVIPNAVDIFFNYQLTDGNNSGNIDTGINNDGSIFRFRLYKTGPNSFFYELYDDGALVATSPTYNNWKGESDGNLYGVHFGWTGDPFYLYNYVFRRYASPGPTVTFDAEQSGCDIAGPPTITDGPDSQSDCVVHLAVTATGREPLSYQWRRNGIALSDGGQFSGSATSSLTIDPVGFGDEGAYDVIVSDVCGSTTSQTATVTTVGTTDCNQDGIPDQCQAGSETFTWIETASGTFADEGNWDRGEIPGPLAHVVFSHSGAADNLCLIDSGGPASVCELSVSSSGSGRQIIQVEPGMALAWGSTLTVSAGGEIRLRNGQLNGGEITNASNTISGSGIVSADVTNQGVVRAVASSVGNILGLTGNVDNTATGELRAAIGSLLILESGSFTQDGVVEARSNATISFDQSVVNAAGGVLQLYGGTVGALALTNSPGALITGFGTIDCSVDNEGEVVVIADTQIVGDLLNNGTIAIQSGVLTVTGGLSGSGNIIGGFGG